MVCKVFGDLHAVEIDFCFPTFLCQHGKIQLSERIPINDQRIQMVIIYILIFKVRKSVLCHGV